MATTTDTLRNFIDGESVASHGESESVLNPATGEEMARAPITPPEEVDRAVEGGAPRVRDVVEHDARASARRRCSRSPT